LVLEQYRHVSGPTETPGENPTPGPVAYYGNYYGIPSFSIQSVVQNNSVTILTTTSRQTRPLQYAWVFSVRWPQAEMWVATTDSNGGGSFTATYTIPPDLVGQGQIAIRMDSSAGFLRLQLVLE